MNDISVTRDDAHLVRLQAQRHPGERVAVVGRVQPWSALRTRDPRREPQRDRRGPQRRRRQVAILLDTRQRNDRRRLDLFA